MTVGSKLCAEVVYAAGAVEVVAARLDADGRAVDDLARSLGEPERARARRLRFERDRRRFVVARAGLRQLLAARLGVAPSAVDFVYGAHGKPALAPPLAASGWRFNVAHCAELAVYAFARERELGVDVEAIRPFREADAIAARVFSERETAAYRALEPRARALGFLNVWTRKEAYVKALGEGVCLPLDRIDVCAAPAGWDLHSFCPLPGFVAAVASQQR